MAYKDILLYDKQLDVKAEFKTNFQAVMDMEMSLNKVHILLVTSVLIQALIPRDRREDVLRVCVIYIPWIKNQKLAQMLYSMDFQERRVLHLMIRHIPTNT